MEPYEQFEKEFGEWTGVENVVGCSSGTAAIHLALESLRLPPGSEVIVPTFTMVACSRAVTLAGLTPVFVDCFEDTLEMNWGELYEQARSRQSSAVMSVHIYGRSTDMEMIHYGAEPRGLAVIEDLAEAHGVAPHKKTDAACWSFYKNKIVAGEEGGAVAFRNPEHAKLARSLRSLGFTDAHDFTHIPRGHNYRLSNANAIVARAGLMTYDWAVARRREIERSFGTECPPEWMMPPREAPWVYDIRIPGMTSEKQNRVVEVLHHIGIPARHAFKPLHTLEEYRGCRRIGGEVAERMSREVIYLPLRPAEVDDLRAREVFALIKKTVG